MTQSLLDIFKEAEDLRVCADLTENQEEELGLSLLSEVLYKDYLFTGFMVYYWLYRTEKDYQVVVTKNPLRAVGRAEVGRTKKNNLKITMLQERFSQHFTNYGSPTFGNTTASYIAVCKENGRPVNERKAEANGRNLRKKDSVVERVKELMDAAGWNDADVDMEHMKVMKQDKDLSNKMRAISEYNKLQQRGANEEKSVAVNIIQYHPSADPAPSSAPTAERLVIDGDPVPVA